MKLKMIGVAAVAAFSLTGAAQAATFAGSFYDVGGLQGGGSPVVDSATDALNFLAGSPTADATFESSGINYLNPPNNIITTLGDFLGADASTLSPASEAATNMLGTILTFSGKIKLDAGNNVFDVFSDDGFVLYVNGSEVDRFEGLRAPSSSIVNVDGGAGGIADFSLVYFEGSKTQAALKVKLNGDTISAVPLPAGLPLMLAGLAALGYMGARRKRLAT